MDNVGSAKFQFVGFNKMISVKSINCVRNQYSGWSFTSCVTYSESFYLFESHLSPLFSSSQL